MTGNDLSFVVAMAVIAISVAMTASVAVASVLIEEALYAAIAWESTGSYEGTCYTVSITIKLTAQFSASNKKLSMCRN